jgi:ankyrin repeat protein
VRLLLATKGINSNEKNIDGWTALMAACQYGHIEIVKLLLTAKVISTNAKNIVGFTALMSACDHGHIEIVKLLLAVKGININVKDNYGRIASDIVNDDLEYDSEVKHEMFILLQGEFLSD